MFLLIHPQTLDKSLNINTNNDLIWGHTFLTYPINNPPFGMGNVLPIATPQGGNNYQPGWTHPGGTYTLGGPQNFSNVPLAGGFNPSQQGGFVIPYTNQSQMGG